MPGALSADGGARALLPAEDPEKGALIEPVPAAEGAPAEAGRRRQTGWQERHFGAWRGAFMYRHNYDFAEVLETSFRGAVWLVLFGTPIIWGLDKDPGSFFYRDPRAPTFLGKVFNTGAIVSFVYTLAPTVGLTLCNAAYGVAGTLTAAAFSLLMYLAFPDGCSQAEAFAPCYFFGVLAGASSITCCLLLGLGKSFQVFYCANFVWFWMAFLNPDSPLRSAPDFPRQSLLGFKFADWGGGVYSSVIKWVSGAALAVIATLLPYPLSSIEQARDSAFATVGVLQKTWANSVEFYLAGERDERRQARMVSSMRAIKDHNSTLKEHLGGSWWEVQLLGLCGRHWRAKHRYLAELEATTTRCLERLTHVIDACVREQFEDIHDEMMRPERCGGAVRALADAAGGLLWRALERADGGSISAEDREELLHEASEVEKAEVLLSRRMWQSIADINDKEARRAHGGSAGSPSSEVLGSVAQQLADEQIFMFSLCDFASSVQAYARWLAEEHQAPLPQACDPAAGLRSVFSSDAAAAPANVNCALRGSLSIFIGFAIGYAGYSEIIPAKSATIPGTIAVLLSQGIMSPIGKSLGRLQGVVLGKFSGQLAYALLGWCSVWAQMSLSAIVFSYVWLTLFIYHYTSPFSYLGCLAAAFGTQSFLVGCSSSVVHPDATEIIDILIAIVLMTAVDLALKMGRPSELAFGAYLDAWAAWDRVLEELLSDRGTGVDPAQISTLISRAEAFAGEAASEPRLWRAPFPGDLFAEMVGLARTMRTQVICIHSVVCEQRPGDDGIFSKKEWFQRLVADEDSGWPAEIARVLGEMDTTHDMVETVGLQNGERVPPTIDKVRREKSIMQKMRSLKLYRSDYATGAGHEELGAETVSLVEDEVAQANFVYGCLASIKAVNFNMQLEMLKRGLV
mmetsp:Transcript_103142/g.280270  ORF Transcript_103142/g.280270 Transcript_103142/m.280270 type:complete len:910 (-) Transcript_103142:72-2801(-)